jgi:hypothetical protein
LDVRLEPRGHVRPVYPTDVQVGILGVAQEHDLAAKLGPML